MRFPILIALAIALSGCASKPIANFANERPLFDPIHFFTGHTHSWGVFETRSGQPKEILHTETWGRLENGRLHFEQDLVFENGKKQHRSWLIRRLDQHNYVATGTGIIGIARGTAYGNAFHLDFTVDALPGNPLGHLHMSQWMYFQRDGITMVNRDTLTKDAVIVAEITEQFHKES